MTIAAAAGSKPGCAKRVLKLNPFETVDDAATRKNPLGCVLLVPALLVGVVCYGSYLALQYMDDANIKTTYESRVHDSGCADLGNLLVSTPDRGGFPRGIRVSAGGLSAPSGAEAERLAPLLRANPQLESPVIANASGSSGSPALALQVCRGRHAFLQFEARLFESGFDAPDGQLRLVRTSTGRVLGVALTRRASRNAVSSNDFEYHIDVADVSEATTSHTSGSTYDSMPVPSTLYHGENAWGSRITCLYAPGASLADILGPPTLDREEQHIIVPFCTSLVQVRISQHPDLNVSEVPVEGWSDLDFGDGSGWDYTPNYARLAFKKGAYDHQRGVAWLHLGAAGLDAEDMIAKVNMATGTFQSMSRRKAAMSEMAFDRRNDALVELTLQNLAWASAGAVPGDVDLWHGGYDAFDSVHTVPLRGQSRPVRTSALLLREVDGRSYATYAASYARGPAIVVSVPSSTPNATEQITLAENEDVVVSGTLHSNSSFALFLTVGPWPATYDRRLVKIDLDRKRRVGCLMLDHPKIITEPAEVVMASGGLHAHVVFKGSNAVLTVPLAFAGQVSMTRSSEFWSGAFTLGGTSVVSNEMPPDGASAVTLMKVNETRIRTGNKVMLKATAPDIDDVSDCPATSVCLRWNLGAVEITIEESRPFDFLSFVGLIGGFGTTLMGALGVANGLLQKGWDRCFAAVPKGGQGEQSHVI